MSLKNTADSYGRIAKWFHWTTAALFLAAYVSVYYRQWFTEKQTPENMTALQIHLSVGVSIAVIVRAAVVGRRGSGPAGRGGALAGAAQAAIGHAGGRRAAPGRR